MNFGSKSTYSVLHFLHCGMDVRQPYLLLDLPHLLGSESVSLPAPAEGKGQEEGSLRGGTAGEGGLQKTALRIVGVWSVNDGLRQKQDGECCFNYLVVCSLILSPSLTAFFIQLWKTSIMAAKKAVREGLGARLCGMYMLMHSNPDTGNHLNTSTPMPGMA